MKEGKVLSKSIDKKRFNKIHGVMKPKKRKKNLIKEIQEQVGSQIEFTEESRKALERISKKERKVKEENRGNKEIKRSNTKIKEDSKIFELEKDTIVGTYQKSRNFGFVVPDDKKLGTDIFISKKDNLKAKNNQKVVVQITKMPKEDKSAEGKIIEIIGYIDQAGVDMMSLIKEHDLPYEFPEQVLNEATEEDLARLVAHELFHVLTRANLAFKKKTYEAIGFTVLDHPIALPSDLVQKLISNPDVSRRDSYASFTIEGKSINCMMVTYTDVPYTEGTLFQYIKVAKQSPFTFQGWK